MGYADDLYAMLHVGETLKHWLEQEFFKTVDNYASLAMQELLAGNLNLNEKLRSGWSRFLMSLKCRTPNMIAKIRGAYDQHMPGFRIELENAFDEENAKLAQPYSLEQRDAIINERWSLSIGRLIQSLVDGPEIGVQINNMRWGIITLPDMGRKFITSDNPVYLSKGLQHDDAYFALPISPRKLFIASKSQAELDRIAELPRMDLTRAANLTVVQQAVTYVYATDKFERNFVNANLGS